MKARAEDRYGAMKPGVMAHRCVIAVFLACIARQGAALQDVCSSPLPMPVGECFWPEHGKPGALANSTLTTAADCCELCQANDKCAFWAASAKNKRCYLMQSGMQKHQEDGCQAGIRPPAPTPPPPPTPAQWRNVLMIAVDDLRPQISCLDAPGTVRPTVGMSTPHICNLANNSLVALRSQVAMATCSPSRTALLTGRHTQATHVWDLKNYFRDTTGNFTTIPQYFKESGYKTAGMGKIFHPGEASGGGACAVCRGADDADYSWTEPYYHGVDQWADGNAWRAVPASEAAEKPLQDSQTLAHAKATLKLVAADHAKSPRQPWFVAVGFHKPHLPFVFPDTFLEKYPAESIQLPPNPYAPVGMPDVAWQSYGETRNYADIKKLNATGAINTTLPDTTVKELRRAYYAAVSYTDDNVGQLLQALEEEGLADDTVVVFWGDHGWHLGEHGEWDKHTNFDLNTHAPVMFRVPGLTDGGVRTSEVSETVDIFPSLVDFAMGEDAYKALSVCESMWDSSSVDTCVEGTSLRPLVAAPRTPVKRAAFSAYNRGYISEPPTGGAAASVLAAGVTSGSSPSDSPCLNRGSHKTGCTMGYTMLTKLGGHELRYTEWVRFTGPGAGSDAQWQPDWGTNFGTELYNHTEDAWENHNVAAAASESVRKELSDMLHAGWQGARL